MDINAILEILPTAAITSNITLVETAGAKL